ncbi:MAG: oligoendopeptidase F [Chloroflexi bacterium]|nr:oligoendopeptidase F [Chloroflexota bacterium]
MADARLPLHSEMPEHYTWNAPSVFESTTAWAAELKAVGDQLSEAVRFQGRLAEGAATLAQALEARDSALQRVLKLQVYADMSAAVESGNQAAQSMASQAGGLFGQAQAAYAFIDPEALAIGREVLSGWLTTEPRLANYAHYFDNLFRKQAHVRSAEVEEMLGLAAEPFGSVGATMHLLTNADFKFVPARDSAGADRPLTHGTLMQYSQSADRELRRTAWEHYADAYLAHQQTLAGNLATSIKQNVFKMRARRHSSTLAMSLFEENVPIEVFHNLIEVFKKNLPTWHRYWRVRRKALGVEALRYYDIWAPLSREPLPMPYERAVEEICAGLAPLGEEYVAVIRRGCGADRWVDVYPNQGKGQGAFSTGVLGTHPFIMMSYNNTLISLSTLAHELGHSMHSYLTWQTQPFVNSNYSLFVAEVASNFHQAMVRAHLLKTQPDAAFQLTVIEEAMSNFQRYFFTMPTLARFELDVHQRVERGEGLTADVLNGLMYDLFAEAFGGEMELDRERVGIIWSQFGHLYADYYVYQYATGISGANALARRILSGVPNAAEDYVRFLKAGASIYPLDALKMAGVDLTTPEPVEAAFEVLAGLVDRLEAIVGK